MMLRIRLIGASVVALLLAVSPAAASITVGFGYPEGDTVLVGETIDVQILADIPEADAIVGWGLDLAIDEPSFASLLGAPAIGLDFFAAATVDGDDLAGLVFSGPGVWGEDVLLATVTISGDLQGVTGLTLSDDNLYNGQGPDLTEGFLLDPPPADSYAEVVYEPGSVTVIPEPASLTLLVLAGGLALLRRRT